jgi:hypothetical protein
MLHFTALRTASAPSVLFLGERNKACGNGLRQPVEFQVLFMVVRSLDLPRNQP